MFDVCVIGGGPAGAALALRLARLNRSVILIEKTAFPRMHVGESLTSGIVPLLQALDVLVEVETAGFIKAPGATVWWANQLQHKPTGGFQVHRGAFDSILLHAAANAGVTVRQPNRSVEMVLDGHWHLRLDSGEVVESKFVADAAGRSRILSGKKQATGARTVALYAYWSKVDPEDGNTVVEAGASQWFWGAPVPGDLFNATVFVDPVAVRKGAYLDLVRESRLLGHRVARSACGEVHACDATSFVDDCIVTPRSIKVGDAAITIDPLSSQGVQTAIGTALHAALVINTLIDRPEDSDLAMQFYRNRLSSSVDYHAQAAADLHRQQYACTPTEFWKKRMLGQNPSDFSLTPSRICPEQLVRVSRRVAFVPVAIATDRYIVQTSGVEVDGRASAYINEFPIGDLLQAISGPAMVKDVLQQWLSIVPASRSMQIMEWALSSGFLEVVNTGSCS